MSSNHVVFEGNVCAAPEVRYTQSGKPVANMRLAQSKRKQDASGKWVDDKTTFVSVTLWGRHAETAGTLAKGAKVCVAGRLEDSIWTDKEGGEKRRTEIVAESLYLATERQDDTQAPRRKARSNPAPASNDDFGDIPF